MTIKSYIEDPKTGDKTSITKNGQLITAPFAYSEPYALEVDSTAAFNFVPPISGKRFVITDCIIEAGKTVSTTVAADVAIFEATAVDSAVIDKSILGFNMIRYGLRILTGLNLITREGKWINITTTDPTINATIMGYYIKA